MHSVEVMPQKAQLDVRLLATCLSRRNGFDRVNCGLHKRKPRVVHGGGAWPIVVGESIPGGEGLFQNGRIAAARPQSSTIGDDQGASHNEGDIR